MSARDDRSRSESEAHASRRSDGESTAAARTGERPGNTPEENPEENDPVTTPFDHPLFLPVLLFAGVLWFGFDGWINQNPEMLEHQSFNRVGFAVLTLLTLWFGRKGYAEFVEDRARRAEADAEGPISGRSGRDADSAPGSPDRSG